MNQYEFPAKNILAAKYTSQENCNPKMFRMCSAQYVTLNVPYGSGPPERVFMKYTFPPPADRSWQHKRIPKKAFYVLYFPHRSR